jgi:hypothetical protein
MVTRSWLRRYPNPDESTGVDNGRMLQEHPLPGSEPIVVQVSRWDRLKDPLGCCRALPIMSPTTSTPT